MIQKITLTLFCLLTLSFPLFSQDTIVALAFYPPVTINFDDRDTTAYISIPPSLDNLWQIGTPSKTVFTEAHSVPLALVTDTVNDYPVMNHSTFEFVVQTDDYTIIDFWHSFDTDSGDGGVVEISTDAGLSWHNVIDDPAWSVTNFYGAADTVASANQPGFQGSSGGWVQSTMISYSLLWTRFRFTFTSDSVVSARNGWMVDDLMVTCLGTGISDSESSRHILIYPSPASEELRIAPLGTARFLSAAFYNTAGQQVAQTQLPTVPVTTWPEGIYLARITTTQGITTQKITITH